jgi:hypothetical protein
MKERKKQWDEKERKEEEKKEREKIFLNKKETNN